MFSKNIDNTMKAGYELAKEKIKEIAGNSGRKNNCIICG